MQAMLKYLDTALYVAFLLFLFYGFWHGLKIEVGKPGQKSYVLIEFYAAKRHFK